VNIVSLEAKSIKEKAAKDQLKNILIDQQSANFVATSNIVRTAYYIVKSDRPFTDHPDLIDLQKLNGVKVGRVLHSNVNCVDIVEHIVSDMRCKIVKCIVDGKVPFSVMVDESTSLSQKSCIVVLLRFAVDINSEPVNVFLDIIELSSLSAESIVETILSCLTKHGFTDEILSSCWVGFGSDGASVMVGCTSGVCVRLQNKFPHIIGWHCVNHRLELSVHDAVKLCTAENHFKCFMDKLYTLYSASPKNRRAIAECATEVNIQLLKIGRVLDTRWLASSYRAVKAVWVDFAALFAHFDKQSSNLQLDSKERSTFSGLRKTLCGFTFIKILLSCAMLLRS